MSALASRRFIWSVFVTMGLVLAQSGCDERETVTHYKPFFTGIGDAQFGETGPIQPNRGRVGPVDAGTEAAKIVVENEDGTKTYYARAPLHVMRHVENLLDENSEAADTDLLNQLVDDETKEHFRSKGREPMEFIRFLHKNRKPIAQLFARMPMAEHSPTVIVEQPGNRTWAIRLTGQATRDIKFTELWVRFDMNQWRLMWIK